VEGSASATAVGSLPVQDQRIHFHSPFPSYAPLNASLGNSLPETLDKDGMWRDDLNENDKPVMKSLARQC